MPHEQPVRMPPHDLNAERGVIGSILLDPRKMFDVAAIVSADDFYRPENAEAFRVMLELDAERIPVDSTVLLSRMKNQPAFVDCGGAAAYLYEAAQAVPVASNAVYYAQIVAGHAERRRLIESAYDLLGAAWDDSTAPADVLAAHESSLVRVLKTNSDQLATATDLAIQASERIDAICDRGQHLGLLTGLETFDERFGGLFGGELIILAARPGRGKSALSCQFAEHAARSGKLTYVASLEMTGVELAMRSICSIAGVNGRLIRTGTLGPENRKSLAEGMAAYSRCALRVDMRSELKVEDIRRTVRRLARDGLALVVIDYLQLIAPTDRKANRYEQVGHQTRILKTLARETQIPIVVLAQVGREAEENERPQLKHLRESGNIEADADVVLLIHRPDNGIMIPDPENAKKKIQADWPAELIVAKNRNGETGTLKLDWRPEYTRFSAWGVSHGENYEDAFGEFV